MSAIDALKAARETGIKLKASGNDLLVEAATPPPDAVLELLSLHKAEILAMLAAAEFEQGDASVAPPDTAREVAAEDADKIIKDEPGYEEPCQARRGRIVCDGGVFLHFCLECGRFGPYGYGVRLRYGEYGRWYCSGHRPDKPTGG